MLILLPPSETKRPGGTGAPLEVDGLALPELAPQREDAPQMRQRLAFDDPNEIFRHALV